MSVLFSVGKQGSLEDAKQSKRLIEPLPRTISHSVTWILNLNTMAIEANSPLAATLGDTCFEEYEPTRDELARLMAGQRVLATHRTPRKKQLIDLPPSAASAELKEANLGGAEMFVPSIRQPAMQSTAAPSLIDAVAAALNGPVSVPGQNEAGATA